MSTEHDYDYNPEDVASTNPVEAEAKLQEEILYRGLSTAEYKGKKLQAFSAPRATAASSMGLRFFSLTRDEIDQVKETGLWRGIEADITIVTWLCLQPKSIVLKSIRMPDWALETSLAWAEKEEFELGNPHFDEAAKFVMQAFLDRMMVKGNLVKKYPTPGGDGKEPEEPKN